MRSKIKTVRRKKFLEAKKWVAMGLICALFSLLPQSLVFADDPAGISVENPPSNGGDSTTPPGDDSGPVPFPRHRAEFDNESSESSSQNDGASASSDSDAAPSEPTRAVPDDCSPGVSRDGGIIPDTFPAGKCLRAGTRHSIPIPAPPADGSGSAPSGIADFLVKIIGLLVRLVGSLSLIIFIIGALLTVTSEGKEDRLEKGKNAMLYSLIGLAVALLSFVIVAFVQQILY